MPEVTSCPSCARQLRVPDSLLGKAVKCPSCGTTFTAGGSVPAPTYQEPPPSSAPPPQDAEYEEPPPDDQEYEERPRRSRRRRSRRSRGGDPHRGGLILALGIISLAVMFTGACAFLTLPLGLPAWLMGNHDLKRMEAGYMDNEGEGATQAGRICGIIGTIIGALVYLGGCAYFLMVFVLIAGQRGR